MGYPSESPPIDTERFAAGAFTRRGWMGAVEKSISIFGRLDYGTGRVFD